MISTLPAVQSAPSESTRPDAPHPDTGQPDAGHPDAGRPDAPHPTPGRADGWTAERQVAFVSSLADQGNVAVAAKAAGMGLSGAYALRRRAGGLAFDLAWRAALFIARNRLTDELMARAIDGEEVITDREDTRTRRRAPNYRLGLSLIDRVTPEKADLAIRTVMADFDAFLDVLAHGGSPAALVFYFRARIRPAAAAKKMLSTLPLPQNRGREWNPCHVAKVDEEWHCTYPPPPGFDGTEYGTFGDERYHRSLTLQERTAYEAEMAAERTASQGPDPYLLARAVAARDLRFGVPR